MLAIVNPAAGGGRCNALADGALQRLRAAGLEIEVERTERPGQASDLVARAYAKGERDFVAAGGDGTSFEVLNGLMGAHANAAGSAGRPRLGFLPLGTGNSFLRDFTDRGVDYALEALLDGRRRPCDVVRLTHDGGATYFMNLMSIGFVADVGAEANRRFKRFGDAGYALAVASRLAGLQPMVVRMRLDGDRWIEQATTFVSLNNSRFTGGKMMMAPYADTGDGLLDVVVAQPLSRLQLLAAFPRIFSGTHVHLRSVTSARARVVEFDLPGPTDLMIDGEVVRHSPQRVEVLSGLLDVGV